MKILKSLVLLIALSSIVMNGFSQQKNITDTKQVAEDQTDQVKKNVDKVTAEQASKILTIEQKFASDMQDAHNRNKGDTVIINKKAMKLGKIRDAKIKAVLTDMQFSQYLDMEKGWGYKLNCDK
jgi:hypothetical protein